MVSAERYEVLGVDTASNKGCKGNTVCVTAVPVHAVTLG